VSEILIRRAEPADAEGIAATFRSRSAAAGTLQSPWPSITEWKERITSTTGRNYLFVALADGEIIGNAGLHGSPNPRREHAYMLGVVVRDDWQRRGVGTRLMETLIDLADNWVGAMRLELTVYTENVHARRMYEKFGFVLEGTFRAYALREGVYVDSYSMARLNPRSPRLAMDVPRKEHG